MWHEGWKSTSRVTISEDNNHSHANISLILYPAVLIMQCVSAFVHEWAVTVSLRPDGTCQNKQMMKWLAWYQQRALKMWSMTGINKVFYYIHCTSWIDARGTAAELSCTDTKYKGPVCLELHPPHKILWGWHKYQYLRVKKNNNKQTHF